MFFLQPFACWDSAAGFWHPLACVFSASCAQHLTNVLCGTRRAIIAISHIWGATSIADDFGATRYCKCESRLVLRSTKIQPALYDVFFSPRFLPACWAIPSLTIGPDLSTRRYTVVPTSNKTCRMRICPVLDNTALFRSVRNAVW